MKLAKITEAFRDVEDKLKDNGEIGDKVSHPVESDEKTAIEHYTGDSRAHNDLLHRRYHGVKGGAIHKEVYNQINTLQKIIHRQPELKGIHVFSGVHADIDTLFHVGGAKPFSILEFFVPSFTSTTTAFEAVGSYAKLFYVNSSSDDFVKMIKDFDPAVTSYRNVLCFDLHGKKALKVDRENGGVFGDEEKEFILPHSATIRISGAPTIRYCNRNALPDRSCVLLIWDAELVKVEDKTISPEHDEKLRQLDTNHLKTAVFKLLNIPGLRLNDQIEYRLVRGIGRLAKMYDSNDSLRINSTGREMSYFEEHFLNFLFELKDQGILEQHIPDILNVFKLINATKKTLLSSPLSDTRPNRGVIKLLELIFDHG